MKKTFAIIALALFIGGISVPAIAAINNVPTQITLNEEDPKKKEKKAETTAEGETTKEGETKKAATKSDGCATEKKAEGDGCATEKKSESKSECG
jgi:hypothetical protein